MNYPQAIAFLDSFLNFEKITDYRYPEAFSLDRVRRLLSSLGDPQRLPLVLHVAGTKGKGSTCAFAASILSCAGLKTGLYTSPHLFSFRERIQISGRLITEEELAWAADRLQPFAGKDLTYFEAVTACAFLHFRRAGVEAAVIEVGLGGRLDATNLVEPDLTAITPISFDHMAKLGNRLSQIAAEKAGILKQGIPAVVAPQPLEALGVIESVAARVGAPLHRVDREVEILAGELTPAGSRAGFRTPVRSYEGLRVPLAGRHQLSNAAAAIRMAELLAQRRPDLKLDAEAIRRGIEQTAWPGRFQLLPGEPPVVVDGAQNAESARALKETVTELFPGRKVFLVAGVSQEKDLEGIAREWALWAEEVFPTQAAAPRAEPAEHVRAAFAAAGIRTRETGPVANALEQACAAAIRSGGLVVVSGSLFVAAEVLLARGFAPPA